MQRTLTSIVLAALVLSFVPATQAEGSANLLRNGSFEYGLGPNPEGWTRENARASLVRTDADARHGSYAAIAVGLPDGDAASRSAPFDVTPGTQLVLTASVKDSFTPLELGLAFDDGSFAMVGDRVRSEAWTTLATRTTVPEGATSARVVVVLRGETYSWLDNVVVRAVAPSTAAWREDFDSLAGWSVTGQGASTVCDGDGAPDCWLSMDPSVSYQYLVAEAPLDVDVGDVTTLSVRFRGGTITGNTDTELEVKYDDGKSMLLRVTHGYASANNGLSFDTTPGGQSGVFGSWTQTGEWHTAVFRIDPFLQTAQARVYDASGDLVGTSPSMATGSITQLTMARVIAANWGGETPAYGWDTLVIE